ncbi:MAG: type II toxin-antitoxin system HicA family toxin [Schwartzia sp.]|nr:type II toxin-antitoxin system HicA family toxin [Schwartzia sp. (in: firmicutes)]
MKDKDLLKLLLKNGWMEINVKGIHHKVKKGNQTLTIPVHGKDMDKGLLQAILKQAGLK